MIEERWAAVLGFEGLYRVSADGRVERITSDGFRPLKPFMMKIGYLGVNLHREGKRKLRLVHRVVLEAFVGPRPSGMEACHFDCDRLNNRVENLRWDTKKANRRDSMREGTIARRSSIKGFKLPDEAVKALRDRSMSINEAVGRFGIGRSYAYGVRSGRARSA